MDSPHAWFTSVVGHYFIVVWAIACLGALVAAAAAWAWDTARRRLPVLR